MWKIPSINCEVNREQPDNSDNKKPMVVWEWNWALGRIKFECIKQKVKWKKVLIYTINSADEPNN